MNDVFTPFSYGQVVRRDEFTNRTKEKKLLKDNLMGGNSVILISPRRIGKSSLIKQVFTELEKKKKLAIVQMDITSFRSEKQFLEEFALKLTQANRSGYKNFITNLSQTLKHLVPMLSYKAGGLEQISLSFNWNEAKKTKEEILRLPEILSEQNGKQQLIAIDEFQSISRFENSESLQYELRSYWQHQKKSSFCLYGSRRHMMEELFSNESAPFYNFGQILKLNRISEKDWIPFITSKFSSTGKPISEKYAKIICEWTQRHTEHVQFLSHIIWTNSPGNKEVGKQQMQKGFLDFLNFTNTHSTDIFDRLSNIQINVLKAILSGEKQLTRQESIRKYHLKSSATALKARKALIKEDLLEQLSQTEYRIINPAFEWWFRTKVLKEDILSKISDRLN
ncbi:MAG: ATP-binding protein [Ekhidna sp.]|nr:ATP-binding protein [Ekhidna sp.]